MEEDWSYHSIENSPYSITAQILAKAALEFKKSKNIILIIPSFCL